MVLADDPVRLVRVRDEVQDGGAHQRHRLIQVDQVEKLGNSEHGGRNMRCRTEPAQSATEPGKAPHDDHHQKS
jgi:hypothetical protein